MIKKLLLTTLAVIAAQSCFADLRSYHVDNCYVYTDKCRLFGLINIRSGWRVFEPEEARLGGLFKLRNGSLVNVVEFGNIICGIRGPKGKIFYIPGDSLGDSPDWTGLNITPPPLPSSEDDAKWAKAEGGWADEVSERPSNAEASAAMDRLQDAKGLPHVKGGVWYDAITHTYNWIGPKSGKKMSEDTDQFISEVGPYLEPRGGQIESQYPPSITQVDTDWARANARRIEAEKRTKEAAGPSAEERASAAHDAQVRSDNDRILKSLPQNPSPQEPSQP